MSQFILGRRGIIFVTLCLGLFSMLSSSDVSLAQEPAGEVTWQKATQIPSPEETSSWFPDLAVDSQGHVHVVWNETDHFGVGNTNEIERVYYSMWDGKKWSQYNDILSPKPDIIRTAITIDAYDTLHFVYGWLEMFYKQAPAAKAISAAAWTSPNLVNSRNTTYLKDIVVYKDTLHIVYDDRGAGNEESECPNCADIFYRHSPDRGLTWSAPEPLFQSDDVGSARAQIDVDKSGTLYVTWDEGWDRFTNHTSDEQKGVYVYSTDGGNTWSSPLMITYPNRDNIQLTVGSDGEGGVMLVWRTRSETYPGIYYLWSKDYGATWSPPKTIPNILARQSTTPFDMYDMATDSAGHIHLLVVGHLGSSDSSIPGLYHFEWDGAKWSTPTALYEGDWYPEYPHLVIHQGNQLHATWFIRQEVFEESAPHQIWYASGQSSSPAVVPEVRPTATPTPTPVIVMTPTSSPTPTPLPTPTPTLDPAVKQISVPKGATDAIYTDVDDMILLVQSLIPAAIIITIVIVTLRLWQRR